MANDKKMLTTHGLDELDVNSSPALTDYVIWINPSTHKPEKILASALKTLMDASASGWASIALTTEVGASGSVAVQVVFKDTAGVTMTVPVCGTFYISEVATGLTRDPADTGLAALTNGVIQNTDAAVHNGWNFVTTAAGLLGFTITAAADSYWAVFQKPDGTLEIVGPLIVDA